MAAPITNATAMPKKIGSREKPLPDFFFLRLADLLRPGLAVPTRRASLVRIFADLALGLALFTTRLMLLSGLSSALRYSYSKRMEGLRLNSSMASSISRALW